MVKLSNVSEIPFYSIKELENNKMAVKFTMCFCKKCKRYTAQEFLKDLDFEIELQCETCGTINQK